MRRAVVVCAFLLVTLTPTLSAQTLRVLSHPSDVQSGVAFPVAVVVRVTEGDHPAPPHRLVATSSMGRLSGALQTTSDAAGEARFEALVLHGKERDAVELTITAESGASSTVSVRLRAGEPHHLQVVSQATHGDAKAHLPQPFEVAMVDAEGNRVRRGGLEIVASLRGGTHTLTGSLQGRTDQDGLARFGEVTINGHPGRPTVSFDAQGLVGTDTQPIELDFPHFDSHLTVGAIKTVSGVAPPSELFHLALVFPIVAERNDTVRYKLTPLVFALAGIDLPLTAQQAREVSGEDGSGDPDEASSGDRGLVSDATASLNFARGDTNNGSRKAFVGLGVHVFDADPLVSLHFGSIELPSSALHGSHMELGWAGRLDRVPQHLPDDSENPETKNNLMASFLQRSDDAPVISQLNVRGTILIPLGRDRTEIKMRLALSVPFADLFSISTGS
jgi:hypothetical protein